MQKCSAFGKLCSKKAEAHQWTQLGALPETSIPPAQGVQDLHLAITAKDVVNR